jgi:hypothetical protein
MEKKDTLIKVSDMMANATNISLAEKELYKDATVKVKLDEANAQMNIVMSCPFKSIKELPEIKKNFFNVMDKLKVFDKLSDKKKPEGDLESNEEMPTSALNPGGNKNQEFTAVSGKIENTVTHIDTYKKELANDSSMQILQQMSALMGEITFKTSIFSAKEIKSYTGNNAILSPNKRIVSFSSSFSDMMENPEKLSYKVIY